MIHAAGVLPYLADGGELRVLLLRNRETRLWEPPKGVCEPGESALATATRELEEETSLSMRAADTCPDPPYSYSYEPRAGLLKHVALFPAAMQPSDRNRVRLSKEHDSWAWVPTERAPTLIQHQNVLQAILSFAAAYREGRAKSHYRIWLQEHLIAGLSESIEADADAGRYSWYLGGSAAAGEHTVAADRLLSDLDLVISGGDPPRSHQIRDQLLRISDDLRSRCEFGVTPRVSAFYVHPVHRVEANAPFWSYFAIYHQSLTRVCSQLRITSRPVCRDDLAYRVFRLVWYAALRARSECDAEPERRYHWVKNLVLAQMLELCGAGRPFKGYAALRGQLRNELQHSKASDHAILFPTLAALNEKLDHRPSPPHYDLERCFYRWGDRLLGEFDDHTDSDALMMARTILALCGESNEFPALLLPRLEALLGPGAAETWRDGIGRSNHDLLWLLLVQFRLKRWSDEIRWSLFRYRQLILQLWPRAFTCAGSRARSWLDMNCCTPLSDMGLSPSEQVRQDHTG